MSTTVLAKTYSGTGRPSMITCLNNNHNEEVARLLESFGYFILAEDKPDSYTDHDAWIEYTRVDGDGFTQWKK